MQVCGSLGSVTACIVRQREYDGKDEAMGRQINKGIGALIKERDPKGGAAWQSGSVSKLAH